MSADIEGKTNLLTPFSGGGGTIVPYEDPNNKIVHIPVSSTEELDAAFQKIAVELAGYQDSEAYKRDVVVLEGLEKEVKSLGGEDKAPREMRERLEKLRDQLRPPVSLTFSSQPAPVGREEMEQNNVFARIQYERFLDMLLVAMGRVVESTADPDQLWADADAAARERDWNEITGAAAAGLLTPTKQMRSEMQAMGRIWLHQLRQSNSDESRKLKWKRVHTSDTSFITHAPLEVEDFAELLPEEEEEDAKSVGDYPWQEIKLDVAESAEASDVTAFCKRLRHARVVELNFIEESEALTNDALLALIAAAGRSLEKLTVRATTSLSTLTPAWLAILAPSCRRLKHLHLQLSWKTGQDIKEADRYMDAFVTSMARYSKLESLEWQSLTSAVQWKDAYTLALCASNNTIHSNLKSLIIAPPFRYTNISGVLAALANCPNLQTLHEDVGAGLDVSRAPALLGRVDDLVLHGLHKWTAQEFRSLFKLAAPVHSWQRVVLNTVGNTNSIGAALDTLAAQLKAGPDGLGSPLTVLHIGHVRDLDWASFGRVAAVAPDLCSVRISSDSVMPLDILGMFVQQCPNMEEWQIGFQPSTQEAKQQQQPELTVGVVERVTKGWKHLALFSMEPMYKPSQAAKIELVSLSTRRRLASPDDMEMQWVA